MPLLQITNGVTRHPDYRLTEPLNLTIEAGEALAICGPNGGGKSLLVDIITGAHPLLGDAEMALHNAQKALDEAEPADEEYTDLRDALQKAQDAYDNISGQLNGYQAQLDEGKRQMYAQGLISSPSLSNEQLVTEAKAALRQMKVKLLQGQLQLTTGTATVTKLMVEPRSSTYHSPLLIWLTCSSASFSWARPSASCCSASA